LHPEFEVVAASCGDGPWNFAAAANRCAEMASGDVFVLTGADLACDQGVLSPYLAGDGWAMPFSRLHSFNLAETDRIIRDAPDGVMPRLEFTTRPNLGCGMLVVSRAAWSEVDGMDARFSVWGCEDNALGHALQRMVGDPVHGDSDLFALGHPRDQKRKQSAQWRQNRALYLRYRSARTPESMRALIDERR
jgi:hypothetical protein